MNLSPETERRVGQLLDRAGRGTPLRRAPQGLESRVLVELERRAALPWWRRSFDEWPGIARAAFLLMCGALIALALAGGLWAVAMGSAQDLSALHAPWARRTLTLVSIARDLASTLSHAVPPHWIYGGLVASAALYAALFGLSVAAYRLLYLKAESAGDYSI